MLREGLKSKRFLVQMYCNPWLSRPLFRHGADVVYKTQDVKYEIEERGPVPVGSEFTLLVLCIKHRT